MKNRGISPRIILGSICALTLAACGSGASGGGGESEADQTFEIKLHDYESSSHPFVTSGVEPFIEEVERESDGRISVELFTDGVLGSSADQLVTARSGTADIVNVVSLQVADKLPLTGAITTFSHEDPTSLTATQAAWELCHEDVLLSEFQAQGVTPLSCVMLPPYELFTTEPIGGIPDDLQGLRVRSVGGLQADFIELLGMTPIEMPSPELYQAIERGTLDGTVFPWYALAPFSLQEQVHYGTVGFGAVPGSVFSYVMNTEKLAALPEDLQQIVYEAGKKWLTHNIATTLDENTAKAQEAVGDAVEVRDITNQERAEMIEMVQPALAGWLKDMQAKGLGEQAREILDAVQERVESVEPGLTIEEWTDYEVTALVDGS